MKTGFDRTLLRYRLVLFALLPALSDILRHKAQLRADFINTRARVRIGSNTSDMAALLSFERGHLNVLQDHSKKMDAPGLFGPKSTDWDLNLSFSNPNELNQFFSGQAKLPQISGALRHPVLLVKLTLLFKELLLLKPGARISSLDEQALYVRTTLPLIVRALREMYLGGHPEMIELVNNSPERIYQWVVSDIESAVWLRMAKGRIQAGRGLYKKRRPFVSFVFPTVGAAFRVLTEQNSSMAGLVRGDIRPDGSPEYSRRLSILLQKADELLNAG